MCVVVARSQGSSYLGRIQCKGSQAVWGGLREELSLSAVVLKAPGSQLLFWAED